MDNYFPNSTSAVLRRGKELYATLGGDGQDVRSLFSYVVGTNRKLFASNSDTIFDVTNVPVAFNYMIATENDDPLETEDGDTFGQNSTDGLDVFTGALGGDWIVVQFATTGGIFLVGVNGESEGFIYDGTAFYPIVAGGVWALPYDAGVTDFTEGSLLTGGTSGATGTILSVVPSSTPGEGALLLNGITGSFQDNETITDADGGEALASGVETNVVPGITFPSGSLTTADLCYVWIYKNRLFFMQKESLDAWYLPVDQIGGELTKFPLGGVFGRGGALLFGYTWSLDAGEQGGLSEQCVFVTSEGEVAVYQGNNPSEAASWSKVGVYRIGRPLGNKAFIRAGGDIVVATTIGFVPLSQAIQRDYAALSPTAVSYPIEDAWNEATVQRGQTGWACEVWPDNQMVVVSPPLADGGNPVLFVANARTGAWSRFTNWQAICMEVFEGELYFGSSEGKLFKANVSGLDDGAPYTGVYMPLFEDFGSPASLKIPELARAVQRSRLEVNELLTFHADFNMTMPAAPDASASEASSVWGVGIWGQSTWGSPLPTLINQKWRSVGGLGYACSVSLQLTSGDPVPTDAEIIRVELTYQTAEIVT
ncbi:hypothetical protein [Mesorhizobium sp. BE184]|uniref:hypothetical protein n=1 Tax=Mesorhizobium sp. BE184 TaxID=2817714 RepID=UPI00286524F4|nr:hypothetical protein [Mesorhizobium sp. BE184]MDR7032434.1 hypothetical protein [Mesorhizobium sp. BE184]